ncbi:uncharacterized protein LOC130220783 [Danio aesculapii]|uniref:uncharacterized protein LOC130220783 n=1 Tax=Danio aesculapii TaxID=1142201 RepID=UPI0024BFD88F|nr:uncharacterized protein LOC130220783 [Danio aesculapii]
MKDTALFAVFLLFTHGVSGQASESQKLSALEGDTVTLHTDITDLHNVDLMMWIYTYGQQNSIIAKLNGKSHVISLYDADDGRFGDRLQLDNQTGSLSIADIRTKHSGDYQLKIISSETSYKTFSLTVYDVFFAGVTNRKEGESVTLHTGVNDIQKHSAVVWKFDPLSLNAFLADLNITLHKSSYSAGERWRNRLKLDERTGALSISDSRTSDTGVYQLQVSSSKETYYKRFNLYIDVPEPGPSSALAASLIFIFLLIIGGVAVAVGVYYYRRKYSKLKDEMKTKEVIKGNSVTLHTGVTDIQKYHKIRWRFGPQGTLVAEINAETAEYPDQRFKDRLLIDSKTGDLTIRDVQITQSGDYQLKLYTDSVRENKSKRFKLIVHGE